MSTVVVDDTIASARARYRAMIAKNGTVAITARRVIVRRRPFEGSIGGEQQPSTAAI